jgi:hypothetical protein
VVDVGLGTLTIHFFGSMTQSTISTIVINEEGKLRAITAVFNGIDYDQNGEDWFQHFPNVIPRPVSRVLEHSVRDKQFSSPS